MGEANAYSGGDYKEAETYLIVWSHGMSKRVGKTKLLTQAPRSDFQFSAAQGLLELYFLKSIRHLARN